MRKFLLLVPGHLTLMIWVKMSENGRLSVEAKYSFKAKWNGAKYAWNTSNTNVTTSTKRQRCNGLVCFVQIMSLAWGYYLWVKRMVPARNTPYLVNEWSESHATTEEHYDSTKYEVVYNYDLVSGKYVIHLLYCFINVCVFVSAFLKALKMYLKPYCNRRSVIAFVKVV